MCIHAAKYRLQTQKYGSTGAKYAVFLMLFVMKCWTHFTKTW